MKIDGSNLLGYIVEIQIEPLPGVVHILPLVIRVAPQSGVVLILAMRFDMLSRKAKSLQYGCAISIQNCYIVAHQTYTRLKVVCPFMSCIYCLIGCISERTQQ